MPRVQTHELREALNEHFGYAKSSPQRLSIIHCPPSMLFRSFRTLLFNEAASHPSRDQFTLSTDQKNNLMVIRIKPQEPQGLSAAVGTPILEEEIDHLLSTLTNQEVTFLFEHDLTPPSQFLIDLASAPFSEDRSYLLLFLYLFKHKPWELLCPSSSSSEGTTQELPKEPFEDVFRPAKDGGLFTQEEN